MNARIALLITIGSLAALIRWTPAEIAQLRDLSITRLEPLGPDRTNRVADDPRASALGLQLFFDERLSSNGKVSCATCHQPDRAFQDGSPLSKGVGTTSRRAMPIRGTAYAPFLFWDGRKDSQWAQALGPLESDVEHGGSRAQYAHIVSTSYRDEYEQIFGALPASIDEMPADAGPVADQRAAAAWRSMTEADRDDVTRVFVNIGKAIAAYERLLQPAPSRFDRYVDQLGDDGDAPAGALTQEEVAGLRLFIGKAACTQCHNGPLFTSNEFHNTGVPAGTGIPEDHGRMEGARSVLHDEFNCRSRWSDANGECPELEFLITDEHQLERAYKVPSLRGVANRAPYMHAGQFATLEDVLLHYDKAPKAPSGHSELKPLHLSPLELRQLAAFLRTLDEL